MDYLKEIQRRVKEIELSRWVDYYLNDALTKYEAGQVDADGVANIADRRGFFSVWFTVFMAHKAVKKALIDRFEGTALDCFDEDCNPIPRNPNNLDDPL